MLISCLIFLYFKSIRKLSSWLSYPQKSEGKKKIKQSFFQLIPINHRAESLACKFDCDLCAFWTPSA